MTAEIVCAKRIIAGMVNAGQNVAIRIMAVLLMAQFYGDAKKSLLGCPLGAHWDLATKH